MKNKDILVEFLLLLCHQDICQHNSSLQTRNIDQEYRVEIPRYIKVRVDLACTHSETPKMCCVTMSIYRMYVFQTENVELQDS